jgi:hypothetical protein
MQRLLAANGGKPISMEALWDTEGVRAMGRLPLVRFPDPDPDKLATAMKAVREWTPIHDLAELERTQRKTKEAAQRIRAQEAATHRHKRAVKRDEPIIRKLVTIARSVDDGRNFTWLKNGHWAWRELDPTGEIRELLPDNRETRRLILREVRRRVGLVDNQHTKSQ